MASASVTGAPTAQKAPIIPSSIHPLPVMRPIKGCPFLIFMTLPCPATTSVVPVITTTAPVRFPRDTAAFSGWSVQSPGTESTPHRFPVSIPISACSSIWISETFPRITDGLTALRILRADSLRKADAVTPTGSRITGCPRPAAFFPARIMASTRSSSRVPMFSTRLWQMDVTSSTSLIPWAMMGEPPMASTMLATSPAVT